MSRARPCVRLGNLAGEVPGAAAAMVHRQLREGGRGGRGRLEVYMHVSHGAAAGQGQRNWIGRQHVECTICGRGQAEGRTYSWWTDFCSSAAGARVRDEAARE